MKFNEGNTKRGDIFVGIDEDIKNENFHGKIKFVNSWGVEMYCPWLTSFTSWAWTWAELNECFKKPKRLNPNNIVTQSDDDKDDI